jgi:RNA polymerase sigma factor (sigma-70 family)
LAAVPSIGRASLVEAPRRAPQAAATEGLYERHAAKIQSYCHHQLGSREEAEDAVQTTFMNAFRALGRGVVPEAESAWLFKIAENVCLSRRRSTWRRGRIESPSDFEVIEEIVPGPSRQRDELIGIEDALASMPEQQRRAILLREWQGLSYREIADELEVSQSAVETLIFRARRSLAQGLEQPDSLKKPKRKSFRRALHMIDLGTIAAALKTLLAGSAAVKATAAAVAVTAAAGTAAGVAPKLEGKRHDTLAAPAPALAAPAPAQPAAAPPTFVVAPPAVSAPRSATAGGPVRKAKKAGEKATAKPPVRRRVAPTAPPVAVAPVEQPAAPAEPVAQPHAEPAAAPAPAQPAVDKQAEKKAEQKQDEGKQDTPKGSAAPVAEAAPAPDKHGDKGFQGGTRKGK